MCESTTTTTAEIRRNLVSKHQIEPEYGELAGCRGTGRPNPSREIKFSGANGDREIFIFHVQLTTSMIGHPTRVIGYLLHAMTIKIYIRICVNNNCPSDHKSIWAQGSGAKTNVPVVLIQNAIFSQ